MAQNERDNCPNVCVQLHMQNYLAVLKKMKVLTLLFLSAIHSYIMISPGLSEARSIHNRCFSNDTSWKQRAKRLLKRIPRSRCPSSGAEPRVLTPTDKLQNIQCSIDYSSGQQSSRSVSPWRLRNNHDEDRYPSEIPVAECLCEGCIINGKENRSYNSVLVMHNSP
ncbi:hypothetical protein GJAV_G00064920 [Gymnothorax javanicus]|nr:hypothetical protein GJAV_G00064920 [Gymnothorax javanicus]